MQARLIDRFSFFGIFYCALLFCIACDRMHEDICDQVPHSGVFSATYCQKFESLVQSGRVTVRILKEFLGKIIRDLVFIRGKNFFQPKDIFEILVID